MSSWIVLKTNAKLATGIARAGRPMEVSSAVGGQLIDEGLATHYEPGEEAPPESLDPVADLNHLKLAELKDLARDMDIDGYGSMKKAALIEAIQAQSELPSLEDLDDAELRTVAAEYGVTELDDGTAIEEATGEALIAKIRDIEAEQGGDEA